MLSLRVVISAIAALSVATVAAVTLSITLTSSLAALRSVGTGQAEALLRAAQLSSEALFAVPQDAAETLQNKSRALAWANPSTSAAVRGEWLSTMDTLNLQAGGRLSNLQLYFADNTIGFAAPVLFPDAPEQRPAPFTGYTMVYGTPITNTSDSAALANQSGAGYIAVLNHAGNRTELPHADPRFDSLIAPQIFVNIATNGLWDNTLMFVTGGGRRNVNAGVFSGFTASLPESFYVFMAPLYRQAEIVGIDKPYAVVVNTLLFDDLNLFLRATKATPGTLAVAYDRLGFMVASSADEPTTSIEEVPFGSAAPTGCTTTEATQTVFSATANYRICRHRAATYGDYAALSAAVAEPAFAFAADRRVQLLRTDDGVYFAGAAQVPVRFRGTSVHLLVLMPEVDVIGDVVRSRNVAIGVTCAAFVIVAALTFAAITLLLAPLHTIAERMQRAADFDDDGEDESVSAMAEVAALQRAYYEMNDELNRIRSFVPQSVLVAKRMQREDDDYDADLSGDVDDSVTATATDTASVASRASRRSAKSHASAAAGGAAGQETGLLQLSARHVAVLVANVQGFSAADGTRAARGATATETVLAALVGTVEAAVSAHGGVLGGFHGDHFTATFNAVKHCGAAPRRACAAAWALIASSSTNAAATTADANDAPPAAAASSGGLRLKLGVAAGKCQVGNVGSATTKTFSVVGPAFPQALMLERLSRLYGAGCDALLTARVCEDVVTQYRFRYVDHVVLPPQQPTLVAALLGPVDVVRSATSRGDHDASRGPTAPTPTNKASNDDEWLYVLHNQQADDVNAPHNAAFKALAANQKVQPQLQQPAAQGIPEMDGRDTATTGGALVDTLSALLAAQQQHESARRHGPTSELGKFHGAFLRQ